MDVSELPEISDIPSEPVTEDIRTSRLSLIEDKEKSAVEKMEYRFEQNNKHGDQNNNDHDPEQCERENEHNKEKGKEGIQAPFITDPNAPKDKGYFVLLTVGLFGLVHMLPLIFLFQANEYWMYKFRNTTDEDSGRTYLQANFYSFLKIALTAPGVVCTLLAAVIGHKVSPQARIFSVLLIHSTILIVQLIFVLINTDDWQLEFFVINCVLIVLMAASMSLGGSGSMGLIAKLPQRYIKAQLIGESSTAIFSGLLRLLSIFSSPSTVDAALIYFSSGAALMAATSIIFYFATQTTFFRYYTKDYKEVRKQKIRNIGDFWAVLKIIWPVALLSLMPVINPVSVIGGLVESEFKNVNEWGDKYFVTVCIYLIPAFAGVLGRGIFNYMDYDCSVPLLCLLAISRETIFTALMFLSNEQPRNHLPVLLTHDWQYALMNAGNSITSGFVSNLLTLKTMRMVPQDRIELSMMCGMFFTSLVAAAASPLGVLAVKLL